MSCTLVNFDDYFLGTAVATSSKKSPKESILKTIPAAVQQHLKSGLDWSFDIIKLEEMTGKRCTRHPLYILYNTSEKIYENALVLCICSTTAIGHLHTVNLMHLIVIADLLPSLD